MLTTLGSTEIYLSGRGSRLQRAQQGRVPRPSQGPAGAACYRVFSTLRNSCRKGLGGFGSVSWLDEPYTKMAFQFSQNGVCPWILP